MKNSFPNIKAIERPPYKLSEQPLNPNWIRGFTEGDQSKMGAPTEFIINKN